MGALMQRFEHRPISTPINRAELDSLGMQGWRLAAVDGAVCMARP